MDLKVLAIVYKTLYTIVFTLISFCILAIVEGRGLAKGEIGMAAINLKGFELSLFQVILI